MDVFIVVINASRASTSGKAIQAILDVGVEPEIEGCRPHHYHFLFDYEIFDGSFDMRSGVVMVQFKAFCIIFWSDRFNRLNQRFQC